VISMPKVLVAVPEKCTGCRICELACAYHHFKVINPSKSRVRVVRIHHEPADAPVFCTQCGLCIGACPFNALKRDLKTGAVIVDEGKCTGCGVCVQVCPYGAAVIDRDSRKLLICDLCGGDPECVKHCPEGALIYVDAEEAAAYKRLLVAKLHSKPLSPYSPDSR